MSKTTNNIVQLSQYNQKFTSDDIYNKCHDRWINIKRACNPSKTIVAEAILYIAAIEFLFFKNPNEVIFDSDLLLKKFVKGSDQRARYRKQLGDLYNIKWHPRYEYQGKIYKDVFSCTRTENSVEILNDPKGFYSRKNAEVPGQKCGGTPANLRGLYIDIEEYREEIEDIPQGYISSISQERDAHARQDLSNVQSSDLLAACSAASQSPCTNVEVSKKEPKLVDPANPVKPRIVVTAAMQNGTAQLPLLLQVSGLASSEVNTTTPEPRTPLVPLPTAEQESEQFKAHRNRSHHQQPDDKPQHLGSTILSLLPNLGLAANSAPNTHQKGIDFQLAVEHSSGCGTIEPSIPIEVPANLKHQTQSANLEETEDSKMAVLPYRDEETDWAKDFKTQMTSDCQFEHEIDFWEYKAALKAMELEYAEDTKLLTLTGSYFDIKDLKKKHLKVFAANFYQVLPEHEFKLIEENKQ